jgi:hypothetical protein
LRISVGHRVPEKTLDITCDKAMGKGGGQGGGGIEKKKFREMCDRMGAEQKLTVHY